MPAPAPSVVLMSAAACAWALSSAAVATPPAMVELADGAIRGVVYGNTYRVFRGVPFAAPPTGEARWQPPRAVQPWRPAVREAYDFAPVCSQQFPRAPEFDGESGVDSEDCLSVW